MTNNPLHIIDKENQDLPKKPPSSLEQRRQRKEEIRAKFERLWLIDPEKFNPMNNCMGRERIQNTWDLLLEFTKPADLLIADLGCGLGTFDKLLANAGAQVHAIDIATLALKRLKENVPSIAKIIQDYVPRTSLQDDLYDVALGLDLIAYLPADEYRLFFSELSRIITPRGYVICSTPLDINSTDPLEKFALLAETEFKIEKWVLRYHRLYIRCCDFFEGPERFARASRDPDYKNHQLSQRVGFSHWWFKINSQKVSGGFWRIFQYFTTPLSRRLKQNHTLMKRLEKICHFFWGEAGISHVIFIGSRRPLASPPFEEPPKEIKHKKQVWE